MDNETLKELRQELSRAQSVADQNLENMCAVFREDDIDVIASIEVLKSDINRLAHVEEAAGAETIVSGMAVIGVSVLVGRLVRIAEDNAALDSAIDNPQFRKDLDDADSDST